MGRKLHYGQLNRTNLVFLQACLIQGLERMFRFYFSLCSFVCFGVMLFVGAAFAQTPPSETRCCYQGSCFDNVGAAESLMRSKSRYGSALRKERTIRDSWSPATGDVLEFSTKHLIGSLKFGTSLAMVWAMTAQSWATAKLPPQGMEKATARVKTRWSVAIWHICSHCSRSVRMSVVECQANTCNRTRA